MSKLELGSGRTIKYKRNRISISYTLDCNCKISVLLDSADFEELQGFFARLKYNKSAKIEFGTGIALIGMAIKYNKHNHISFLYAPNGYCEIGFHLDEDELRKVQEFVSKLKFNV